MKECVSRHNKISIIFSDMDLWSIINTLYIAIESYERRIMFYESLLVDDTVLSYQVAADRKYLIEFKKLLNQLEKDYNEAFLLNSRVEEVHHDYDGGDLLLFKTSVSFSVDIPLNRLQINSLLVALNHIRDYYNIDEKNALDDRSNMFYSCCNELFARLGEYGNSNKLYHLY